MSDDRCPVCLSTRTPFCAAYPNTCIDCAADHAYRGGERCNHCHLMATMTEYLCGCGGLIGAGPTITKLGKAYACTCAEPKGTT